MFAREKHLLDDVPWLQVFQMGQPLHNYIETD